MNKKEIQEYIQKTITESLLSAMNEIRASSAVIKQVNAKGLKGAGGNAWKDNSGKVVAKTSADGSKLVPFTDDSSANRRNGTVDTAGDVGGAISAKAGKDAPIPSAFGSPKKIATKKADDAETKGDETDHGDTNAKKSKVLGSLDISKKSSQEVEDALKKAGLSFNDVLRFKSMMLKGEGAEDKIALRKKYGFDLEKIRRLNYVLHSVRDSGGVLSTLDTSVPLEMLTDAQPPDDSSRLPAYREHIHQEYNRWKEHFTQSQHSSTE